MAVESYLFTYAQKQKKKKVFFLTFITLVSVLVFLQLLLFFIVRPLRITSPAMEPEISKNSAVFLTPLINGSSLFSSSSALSRGSLVTLNNNSINDKTGFQQTIDFIFGMITFQQFRPFETTRWGDSEVYRIVGMPGDTLYIENYIAYIRRGGESHFLTEFELSDIDYDILSYDFPKNWNMSIGAQGRTKEVFLKKGEYFLLCDNRIISTDSRFFGAVKQDDINGKVVFRYFPFNSIRAF